MTQIPFKNRDAILEIGLRYNIRKIRVFGSVARGEATAQSDLDLLVDVEKKTSLLDLIAFWQEVEDALGHKVDVVTEEGLSPYLRERILNEAVPL